ncbi:MAG: RNB domain-containing ribonuclease [Thermosynechococcaceae cyanobacterium]
MIEPRRTKEPLTQAKTIAEGRLEGNATQPPADLTCPEVQGITIDSPTSLDLDDSIWCEETATGATLQIHVSDVSEYIPPALS